MAKKYTFKNLKLTRNPLDIVLGDAALAYKTAMERGYPIPFKSDRDPMIITVPFEVVAVMGNEHLKLSGKVRIADSDDITLHFDIPEEKESDVEHWFSSCQAKLTEELINQIVRTGRGIN
ncbi:hypothetical protein WA1_05250 [Scytonema hofmannii PCC 7110]|uniref:Uncharacterized protein n=1 Tax=Scytonema hofmannii PCC 7110 TaxID=128403 RepID=A0A139WZL9_9CYAN|nr:hypothetical protein [Scytonema hofmannii]KYC37905.1 hypothetical protein WA1_05250 [Scytonema hofmannii PCC 7110]